jgi:hypothetical protein
VTFRVKSRIAERTDAAITRRRRVKHVPATTYTDGTTDDAVFLTLFVPRLYNEDKLDEASLLKHSHL